MPINPLQDVGIEIRVRGIERALDRLSPSRFERVVEGAAGLATRYLLKVIKDESRVGASGDYWRGWYPARVPASSDVREIVNDVPYAEFVTGARQTTTVRGRRRGAGEFFMRKIKQEHSGAVRRIIEERIAREFR